MKRLLVLAGLGAALARAEDPVPAADPRLFAEPSADTSPTPYACTAETLAAGAKCIFESQAGPAADAARQAIENAQAAARLADGLCAKAARHPQEPIPDPEVLAACKRMFTERAMGCGADGTRPLVDSAGRFGEEFRVCYSAMGQVLARARTMAASSGPCCRCLVAARCIASGERCNQDALERTLEGPAARCAAESCADACRAQIPVSPGAAGPPSIAAPPPGPPMRAPPCIQLNAQERPCVSL